MLRPMASLVAVLLTAVSVQAAPPLPEARPESLGFSIERLQRLDRVIEQDVAEGRIPGAVIAIARRGRLAYFKAYGWRDKAVGLPMTTDTIFPLNSLGKPLVAVAALMLYEQGQWLMTDPLSKYLPQFANMNVARFTTDATGAAPELSPALKSITLLDLLRNTSGLSYAVMGNTSVHQAYPPGESAGARVLTSKELIDKLASLPLLYQPGTTWEYGASTTVLGIALESVVRQPLSEFLAAQLFRPLRMADSHFLVPGDKASRYSQPLSPDPLTGKPPQAFDMTQALKFDCSACSASTAGDYLRFAQMLLNGGTLDGVRLLGRKTVDFMATDQLPAEPEPRVAAFTPYTGYGFGLGVAVRRQGAQASSPGSAGEFGWIGALGQQFWVDPKEQLAVVFLLNTRGATVGRYRSLVRALVQQALVD